MSGCSRQLGAASSGGLLKPKHGRHLAVLWRLLVVRPRAVSNAGGRRTRLHLLLQGLTTRCHPRCPYQRGAQHVTKRSLAGLHESLTRHELAAGVGCRRVGVRGGGREGVAIAAQPTTPHITACHSSIQDGRHMLVRCSPLKVHYLIVRDKQITWGLIRRSVKGWHAGHAGSRSCWGAGCAAENTCFSAREGWESHMGSVTSKPTLGSSHTWYYQGAACRSTITGVALAALLR